MLREIGITICLDSWILCLELVDEVIIRQSRLIQNDRGALSYSSAGEMGPSLLLEECSIQNNGYHLFGNITTSTHAVELHLHNTLVLTYFSICFYFKVVKSRPPFESLCKAQKNNNCCWLLQFFVWAPQTIFFFN